MKKKLKENKMFTGLITNILFCPEVKDAEWRKEKYIEDEKL